MDINEFAKKVFGAVEKELGGDYRIELKNIRKNNGVILHGLAIASAGQRIVPTIYLDSFWEAYREGVSFSEVIADFLRLYRDEALTKNIDMEFFRHFDRVRERVCYRLIRREGNEELLQECPHVEFLDLAVCFYYACGEETLGKGTVLIKNAYAMRWGVKTADLMRAAEKNTGRLFPWECVPMKELLMLVPPCADGEDGFFERHPINILTNSSRIQGAAAMLYPGVLEKLARKARRSLYILPSSIHEGATRFAA